MINNHKDNYMFYNTSLPVTFKYTDTLRTEGVILKEMIQLKWIIESEALNTVMKKGVEITKTCCPWSHGLQSEKLQDSVAVPPIPVIVPSRWPLAPECHQSRLSSNIKVMKCYRDVCTDILAFTAYGNPRKSQLEDYWRRLCDES